MTPHEEACSQLQVGDKVKVLRSAESYRDGWDNTWTSSMHDAIGKTCTVKIIDKRSGIYFEESDNLDYCWFPAHVLEKVVDTDVLGAYVVWLQANHTDAIREAVRNVNAYPSNVRALEAGDSTALSHLAFSKRHGFPQADKLVRSIDPLWYRAVAKLLYEQANKAAPVFKAGDKVKILVKESIGGVCGWEQGVVRELESPGVYRVDQFKDGRVVVGYNTYNARDLELVKDFAAAAKPTPVFKVGDTVRVNLDATSMFGSTALRGQEVPVNEIDTDAVKCRGYIVCVASGYCYKPEDLTLVATTVSVPVEPEALPKYSVAVTFDEDQSAFKKHYHYRCTPTQATQAMLPGAKVRVDTCYGNNKSCTVVKIDESGRGSKWIKSVFHPTPTLTDRMDKACAETSAALRGHFKIGDWVRVVEPAPGVRGDEFLGGNFRVEDIIDGEDTPTYILGGNRYVYGPAQLEAVDPVLARGQRLHESLARHMSEPGDDDFVTLAVDYGQLERRVIDWKFRPEDDIHHAWQYDIYRAMRQQEFYYSGNRHSAASIAALGAGYLDKEPYDFNTIKRKTPMSIKIETITFVNGQDVNKMSDDQIFDTIAATEQEIARLNSTEHKPASLQKRIDGLVAGIEQLVALSDARPAK